MPESRIREVINKLFKDAGTNITEDRVTDYIVLELKTGRDLREILVDPYVTNRIPENHMAHLLEHKEIFDTVSEQIKESLKQIRQ